MTEQHVDPRLPLALAQDLLDARERLQERYIGAVPACYDQLEQQLLANYPDPVLVVDVEGQTGTEGTGLGRELTAEEDAEFETMLTTLWSASWAAGRARDDRFAAFCAQARGVSEQRLRDWLDDYAERFQRERDAFTRAQQNALRAGFKDQEARA